MYQYKARVTRVLDGDTFDAEVDLGFLLFAHIRFRLKDVDCPETYHPKTNAEFQHGVQARDFVKNLIEGKYILITSVKAAAYNRWEAVVTYDNKDLATLLKENNLVKLSSYI